jgi:TetR/AcrR family transcriptional repressor of nem operon
MLAAEYQTLPQAMQDAVIRFFDQNESWLEGVLEQGRADGSLHFAGSARDIARMIVGVLKGRCSSPAPTATSRDSRPRRPTCWPA